MKPIHFMYLIRDFNMLLSGVSLPLGAIAAGIRDPAHLLLLYALGCLGHIALFVHNDVCDREHDRGDTRRIRPVGTLVTVAQARRVMYSALAGMVAVAFLRSHLYGTVPAELLAIVAATVLVMLYNAMSKRYPFMEFAEGAGVALFVLYGARAALAPLPLLAALWAWFQVALMTGYGGALKDLDNDARAGASSTLVRSRLPLREYAGWWTGATAAVTFSLTIALHIHIEGVYGVSWYWFVPIYTICAALPLMLLSQLAAAGRGIASTFKAAYLATNMLMFLVIPIALALVWPPAILFGMAPPLGAIVLTKIVHGGEPRTM